MLACSFGSTSFSSSLQTEEEALFLRFAWVLAGVEKPERLGPVLATRAHSRFRGRKWYVSYAYLAEIISLSWMVTSATCYVALR